MGTGIIHTQRKPVTWALLAAAGFFMVLFSKNLLDHDTITAGLCVVAAAVALVYAQAIYRSRPQPMSDPVLVVIALCVLAVTIDRRGLVGVLWCHPLMLMLHLVTSRRASAAFDAVAFALGVGMSWLQHDGDTAFRVGVILLVSSAFAHLYSRIVSAHQRSLEEQRQHLDLLVRCAQLGGLEWDASSDHMRCSARLHEMLGRPAGVDQPGWNILSHVHPEDRTVLKDDFFSLIRSRASPGQIRQAAPHEFRLLLADGSTLWAHAEAIAVAGPDGRTQKFIATFMDISQLRAAEADTLAALHRQKELNELRARFVAMTSHEFRTPLATILSSAELLKYYSERLPADERAELLGRIEEGVQRMTGMLERILLINKADAQMMEFHPQRLDLRILCREIVDEVLHLHSGTPCTVECGFTLKDPMGEYDAKLLHAVFSNLLGNALKYSPAGGKVVFTARNEGEHTVFEICDQGIGIPAKDLPDLFEPFQRGSNVADIKGTGLGLTIVKKSVEGHGGRITVQSTPGEGTCFTVILNGGAPAATSSEA